METMNRSSLAKSSFSLPPAEVKTVARLKKELGLASNTSVVRLALQDLQKKVERGHLREQFRTASLAVREVNRQEMEELDRLEDEGLSEH